MPHVARTRYLEEWKLAKQARIRTTLAQRDHAPLCLSVHRQRRWRQDAWCQQEKRDTMLQGEKSGSLLLSLIPRSWKAACAARQPSPVACRPHASQCLRHCSASERRRNNLSSSLPSHPLPAYTGSAHTHTRTHAGTHGAHHLTFASDSSIAFPFAVASLLRGIR